MNTGEAVLAKLKSKSYWLGVVKGAVYPVLEELVKSTDNQLDDAGLALGKQFLEQILADAPVAE